MVLQHFTGLDGQYCIYRILKIALNRGYKTTIICDATVSKIFKERETKLYDFKTLAGGISSDNRRTFGNVIELKYSRKME
jgi:hypothetical protein